MTDRIFVSKVYAVLQISDDGKTWQDVDERIPGKLMMLLPTKPFVFIDVNFVSDDGMLEHTITVAKIVFGRFVIRDKKDIDLEYIGCYGLGQEFKLIQNKD